MNVAQKLGIVLLAGIALAGSDFQGTTLATDITNIAQFARSDYASTG